MSRKLKIGDRKISELVINLIDIAPRIVHWLMGQRNIAVCFPVPHCIRASVIVASLPLSEC